MEQKITVRNNQSLFDIALQEAGTIEAVFDFVKRDNLSVTVEFMPGSVISLDSLVTINMDVQSYYKGNNIHPATGGSIPIEEQKPEGVDFWAVGIDFIVS